MARLLTEGFEFNSTDDIGGAMSSKDWNKHFDINPPQRSHKPECESKVYEGEYMLIVSCTCYPPKFHEEGLNGERVEF